MLSALPIKGTRLTSIRTSRTAASRTLRAQSQASRTSSKVGASARVEGGKVLRKPARKKKARAKKQRFSARTADKYELYQLAVQSADTDVAFLRRLFKKLRGRDPLH